MQFRVLALALAAMATVASAKETVTVYACSTAVPTGHASHTHASHTVASTGGVAPPVPTSSPIAPFTGAASVNGVSALGLMVAGGVALFL